MNRYAAIYVKKIISFSLGLICMFFLLCSCGIDKDEDTGLTVDSDGAAFSLSTDDQPDYNFIDGKKTYTEDGYYYFMARDDESYYLIFHDNDTQQDVYVCDKASCFHNDEDCNAYFDREVYPEAKVFIYNDCLYMFYLNEDYYAIEKISPDGSERETSCTLYRIQVETSEGEDGMVYTRTYYPEYMVHRGYVYYSTYYPGCSECSLYRVKLDSDEEAEEICTIEDDAPDLYRLKGYGNYLYFQKGVYLSDSDEYVIDIYSYNLSSGEVSLCLEDAYKDYTVCEDYIYYFDAEFNIVQYNVSTGETKQVVDNGGEATYYDVYIFVKDGMFYYADSNEQRVYNSDGALVETLTGDDMVNPYTD